MSYCIVPRYNGTRLYIAGMPVTNTVHAGEMTPSNDAPLARRVLVTNRRIKPLMISNKLLSDETTIFKTTNEISRLSGVNDSDLKDMMSTRLIEPMVINMSVWFHKSLFPVGMVCCTWEYPRNHYVARSTYWRKISRQCFWGFNKVRRCHLNILYSIRLNEQ